MIVVSNTSPPNSLLWIGEVGVLAPPAPPTAGPHHTGLRLRTPAGERIRLLFNAAAMLVAAADDPDDPGDLILRFRAVLRGDLFELAGFRVADADTLLEPLTDRHIARLSPAERRDVDYHRPPRVGDVIFNWFD